MNKQRTILVLTNNIGGLHSFRKEVIRALREKSYDVVISAPDDDVRKNYFQALGCSIVKTNFNRRGKNAIADVILLLDYLRLMRKLHPVAVLSYTIKPNIYGGIASRLMHIPQLANITGLGDAIENGGFLQHLTLCLYRVGISKAHKVFFQNTDNKALFIEKKIVGKNSILLPGSGVNLEFHRLQPYPGDSQSIKFLFVGRLLKDKGIEEYFRMAEIIKKQYPSVEFHILGACDGDYEKQLDSLTAEGIVKYYGTTSDVRPFLTDIHCTIMPSYHEGMSNVNLESSANGRPVITTDVPGCRETVEDNVTGFLVAPKDSGSLINAVLKFLHLPYESKCRMGLAAREKMEKQFNREIVVSEYLKALVDFGVG